MAEFILTGIIIVLLCVYAKEIRALGIKGLTEIAIFIALASVGRAICVFIPSFQPASFFIICCGIFLGGGAGLICGVGVALVSSLMTSVGPWTIWQLFLWGMMGLGAGFVGGRRLWVKVLYGFLWGYFFGWVINLWWFTTGAVPFNAGTYLLSCASSFWHDSIHAVCNASLIYVFFVFKKRIVFLDRYKD